MRSLAVVAVRSVEYTRCGSSVDHGCRIAPINRQIEIH